MRNIIKIKLREIANSLMTISQDKYGFELTFTFDNEIGNEGNAEDEGDGVTVENDDNNADDNGNDNNDDGNEDDGSTLIPANDEVYRV